MNRTTTSHSHAAKAEPSARPRAQRARTGAKRIGWVKARQNEPVANSTVGNALALSPSAKTATVAGYLTTDRLIKVSRERERDMLHAMRGGLATRHRLAVLSNRSSP